MVAIIKKMETFIWNTVFLTLLAGYLAAEQDFEGHSYDGWYNNLKQPDWGATDTHLLRRSHSAYDDGVYAPSGKDRPNPLEISRTVHRGPAGNPSYYNRTAMLVFFGQQLVEEIVDSQREGCPIEYFNIQVSKDDIRFDPQKKGNVEIPFKRTRFDHRTGQSPNNPRQQLNEITPFLDGQIIYGPHKAWTDAIRSFNGGRLAGTNPKSIRNEFPLDNVNRLPFANPPVTREHLLKPVSRFHRNPRGHENPFLLAFGILWFRWHNLIADSVAKENPHYSDERIFNIARKRVIALYQLLDIDRMLGIKMTADRRGMVVRHGNIAVRLRDNKQLWDKKKIVFYDWLPQWLNSTLSKENFKKLYPYQNPNGIRNTLYSGYNPNLHPGILQEFQIGAMRFGHTLVTPGLWRRTGQDCRYLTSRPSGSGTQYAALRTCNAYWNSREFVEEDLDAIFRGLASTIAEREDAILVPDLTDSLFGPLEFSRRDLAALNIQRGRDHGLDDYNSIREAFGLKRKTRWEDINTYYNTQQIQRLKQLYGNSSTPDNVDLFTGGMLETVPEGPGELFQAIFMDQFLRIRHGDRFWFENTKNSGLTEQERTEIYNTELMDVITAVTGVSFTEIQRNVFMFIQSDREGCKSQPKQLDPNGTYDHLNMLEPCTTLRTYDFFDGSETFFAMTYFLLAACIPVTFLIMYLLAQRRIIGMHRIRILPPTLQKNCTIHANEYRALEWFDWDHLENLVIVVISTTELRIDVFNTKRVLVRYVDIRNIAGQDKCIDIHMSSDKTENLLAIKVQEYDLVLRFGNRAELEQFLFRLESILKSVGITCKRRKLLESYILRNAVTRKHRQERLDKFFKTILNVFQGETEARENTYSHVDAIGDDIIKIELTQAEFGEALSLKPESTFVKHMFMLVDSDKSGRVSFKEFMNIIILLSSENVEGKIRLLFNMYDLRNKGYLTKHDIQEMVRSLLDLSENSPSDNKVVEFTEALYKSAELRSGDELSYNDFKRVFASENYIRTLKAATLDLTDLSNVKDGDMWEIQNAVKSTSKQDLRRSRLLEGYSVSGLATLSMSSRHGNILTGDSYQTLVRSSSTMSRVKVLSEFRKNAPAGLAEFYENVVGYLEKYRLQVFWMCLYNLVTIGIFAERAYNYASEVEHGGLRRITGHGVIMSRGCASVIMFSYACLMLTMCKNLIAYLRETLFHWFIPFDAIHSMHKYIACQSLVFTVLHVWFHGVNLYHICTQSSTDLNCYFREYFRATHELASFSYWAFSTMTGLSGVILTIFLIIVYVFAFPYSRRYLFNAFWITHKLYIAVYVLVLIHGSSMMVQRPHFPYYFLGPVVIFTIDKIVSISRTKLELTVIKAEHLPSDVTALHVKKPTDFHYRSGQWAQVACLALSHLEYHPLTMTSAPHEKHLTFHIRAVGPWTTNIRNIYDPTNRIGKSYPKLVLDGPFGEGHQDWYKYEVSVLIGGGIGVTPFSSILKDIVYKSQLDVNFQCKKVYFLWVTRTQKQFEWVTDTIRELENVDTKGLVTIHIFVTEFKTKFDLRTSMLYICERHFQKIAGRSLFTGLAATTHFGRPNFYIFLESLRHEHNKVKRLGVFSCGPRSMTLAVDKICTQLNKYDCPTYVHHYENF